MIERLAGREHLIRAILVTLVAALCYAGTVNNEFVWADHTVIVDGEAILRSPGDLLRVFVRPLWAFTGAPSPAGGGYYRPIPAISYTIDHAFYGENPAGYHVTNILLHGLVSLFLFLFLSRLFRESRVPLLASLLFAAHPIHVEAVAWVSGRTGLLATVGIVLSLYFYTRANEGRRYLLFSLAAFAFALGSKESAAVLPLLILLTRLSLRRERNPLFSFVREGPFLLLLGLYIAVRTVALGALGTGNPQAIPPALLIPTVLRVLGGYLRLLFIPFPLHTNDAVRISTFPLDPRAFLSLVFLAAVLYGFLRLGRGRRETGFGLLWMAITFLPFLNILPLLHFRAERLLYLPSAGFLVTVAVLLDRYGGRLVGEERRAGLTPGELLTAGLALLLAFGTVARCKTWEDDRTLFTDTLQKNRYAPEAAYMLGVDAYRNGAFPEAAQLLRRSLALDPGYAAFLPTPWALSNLGYAHYKLGDYAGAEPAFREALRLHPTLEKAAFGLALTAGALGRHEEAAGIYRQILARNPEQEDGHYNLALEYEALDSLDRAEQEYERALTINPGRKEALLNVGSLYGRTGRYEEAFRAFRSALEVEPTDPKLHFNMGLLFTQVWQIAGAKQALETALELDPDYMEARSLLEEISTRLGPGEEEPERSP